MCEHCGSGPTCAVCGRGLEKGGPIKCPFCEATAKPSGNYCGHFIGWTNDGKILEPRDNAIARVVLPTDAVVATGVSLRVYRDWVFA